MEAFFLRLSACVLLSIVLLFRSLVYKALMSGFEESRYFRLSIVCRVSVVLKRTAVVVVGNDWRFDNLCGSYLQSHVNCKAPLYDTPANVKGKDEPATKKGDVNDHISEHHLHANQRIDWDSAECVLYRLPQTTHSRTNTELTPAPIETYQSLTWVLTAGQTINWRFTIHMALKMTSVHVVEASVIVNNNSSFLNYTNPDDHTQQTSI